MFILNVINSEVAHFKNLSQKARSLTWSILLYQLANVSIWIFMIAYMVQKSNQIEIPAIFALGFYITMPIAFIWAAFLLKKYSLKNVSLFGLAGMGVMTLILFWIQDLNTTTVFIYGLFYGLPMGLYWATRNFIFSAEISDAHRDYVSGFTGSVGSITSTIIPLIIGWVIALSPSFGWEKVSIYRLIAFISMCFYIIAGLIIKKKSTLNPIINKLWLKNPSKQWKTFRLFTFLGSIQFTLALALPGALIITYIGDEGILGTIIGITSLVSGLCLYILGRLKNAAENRTKILLFGLIPLIISSLLLLVSFNYLSIMIYLVIMIVFDKLYWFVFFPIFFNQVEKNSDQGVTNDYRLIMDQEIFINLGRALMSLVYLFLIFKFDNKTAITIIILLAAVSQIGILGLAKKLK